MAAQRTALTSFIVNAKVLTMSSREIAELVESRHDSVKRTVERCAEKGAFTLPPLVETSFLGSDGRRQTTSVYNLDKVSSLVVVAQLCPEFTAKIVVRWQELETQIALPDFSNPAAAARAWADQHDARTLAETALKKQAPLVEFANAVMEEAQEMSLTAAGKHFGVPQRVWFEFLREQKLIIKREYFDGRHSFNEATSGMVKSGFMRVIQALDEHGRSHPQTVVTGKGLEWLQKLVSANLITS